ncbi:MAG: TrmH family RNA methyltransferase [Myxococcota bacterium]
MEQIVVVLVQPQHPGNVGATARAMKNFGLSRLVIVDPPAYDSERARWMAPGCDEILAKMRIVATLDDALQGVHRALGTTARHRRDGQPVLEPHEAANDIWDDGRVHAILFGREDFGLDSESTRRCEALIRIPTSEHASLNLAQAAVIISHSLFEAGRRRGQHATGRTLGGSRPTTTATVQRPSPRDRLAELDVVRPAATEVVDLLGRVGYLRGTPAHKVQLTVEQALVRGRLSVRHVEALRGMVHRVDWALDNPDDAKD